MSEPIKQGCELDEAEKGGGEFVVAGGDSSMTLAPAEEVFDSVPSAVIAAVKPMAPGAAAFGPDTGANAMLVPHPVERIRVETPIGHDMVVFQVREQGLNRLDVMALARRQAEAEGVRPPPPTWY